ncbi:MAG: hypothetical protein WEB06_03640 [Actinomycetota bacterium]
MRRSTAFLLMAAAAVAFMAPALFTGRTFGATDLLMTYAPYRESFATAPPVGNPLQSDLAQQLSFVGEFWSAARDGRLQLWEPDVGGGIPLFTGMYNQLIPPWFLVFLVVPVALGTTIGMAIALFVGQIGVYGLARRLGLSVSAATFAAVAYAFSGPVAAMLLRIHGALLFPLVLFAIHGAVTEPSRRGRYLALATVAMVFVWSSGFPFAGVTITYVAAGWVAYLAVAHSKGQDRGRRRLSAIVRLGAPAALALVAGTMIASVQLLPSSEFLSETGFLDRRFPNSYNVDLAHLGGSGVSGRFFGAYQDGDWWWPEIGGSNPFEASFTTGLVALVLLGVLVAGVRGRSDVDRSLTRFIMPVGLLVLAGTYVGGIVLAALHVLPYTVNNPVGRARFVGSLAVALAAGYGLDAFVTRSRERGRASLALRLQLAALFGAIAVGLYFAARAASRLDKLGAVARDLAVPAAAALVALGALFLVLRRSKAAGVLIVIVAAAAELQWGAWGFVPASDRDAFYPRDPAYAAIAGDVGPGGAYRFLGRDRNTPRFDTAAFLDLKDARTAFPRMKRYQDLWVALDPNVFRVNRYNPTFDALDPGSPVLDALSVRYLVEPLHRAALETTRGSIVERTSREPLPMQLRVAVPATGIRSLILPLRAADQTCLDGWVELRAGPVLARRLLREVDGVRSNFVLPDVGRPGSTLTVDLSSTSCPVALGDGGVEVRAPERDAVLRIKSIAGWVVYERSSAIPRASLARSTIAIADQAETISFMSQRPAGGAVVVAGAFGSRELGGGTAELVVDQPDRIVVRATSDGAGLLVLRDVDAPGWRASVDGGPAPIIAADHAFRGVAVPDGTSLVEFRYDPPTYRAGLLLALAGLLLAIALVGGPAMGRSLTRRKRTATVGSPEPGRTH